MLSFFPGGQSMKVTGQCHCGAVRYEAEVDPARVKAWRDLVVTARVVSLAIALVACAATFALGQTPIRWILADEYPATSLPGEGDAYFAKAVADRVAAKLIIEPQVDAKSGFRSREQ